MPDSISLFELNKRIKNQLNLSFPDTLWIVAEISDLNLNQYSGHCYLELIEKNEKDESIKAKAKATIWSFTYRMLKPYFETSTGRPFSSGLKVLVKVTIEFHELYSLSLNILDIDPSYTVGDLALKKQAIINKLKEDGIFEMNKELHLTDTPQRIAIVSSKTAAGYEDFVNQLFNNEFSFTFYTKLFPATMQGEKAEASIISALEKIYSYEHYFDVVVIIRGGGSKIDLSCFDNYLLAYYITQFPLPVITGIGHERDDSIVDMVAHTRLKTPTAVAGFLINKLYNFETQLMDLKNEFLDYVNEKLSIENSRLNELLSDFQNNIYNMVSENENKLNFISTKIENHSKTLLNKLQSSLNSRGYILKNKYLKSIFNHLNKIDRLDTVHKHAMQHCILNHKNRLSIYQNTIEYIDPQKILKKGYSITIHKGKPLLDSTEVKELNEIETRLAKGSIISTVKIIS